MIDDFGFWILDFGFWILDFGFSSVRDDPAVVVRGFQWVGMCDTG
jgi:hypothetical protein